LSKRFLVPLTLPGANSLPAAGNIGDLFYKTDESAVYVYTSTGWAELAGGSISGLTANRALASNATGDVVTTEVTDTELSYLDGVTSALQTQLDGKQATITGGATSITDTNLTANRAVASDGSGKVAVSAVTSTELGYVSGVTGAIQTQINAKLNTASPTFTGTQTGPATRLTDTTLPTAASTAHAFQVGASTTTNLRLGPTRIQAVNNGAVAELSIQGAGGQATFGGIATTSVAQAIGTKQFRNVTASTGNPSGGLDGEVWLKYT